MAGAMDVRRGKATWLRAAVLLLLGAVLIWDTRAGALFPHGIWYAPIIILAHFQGSRAFTNTVTLTAIIALWISFFLAPTSTLPHYDMLPHCLGASLALLAIHAGFRHYFLQCERERKVRENLFRQKHRLEALAESLPLHIWTATAEGEVEVFGQGLTGATGKSREEIQKDWTILLHPDDRERSVALWSHALATGQRYENEARISNAQGRYIWYLLRAIPERDAQGTIMRWMGSAQEINHIHALRAEAQALADRLHNTLESITDALFALDDQFRLTYINAKAATVLSQSGSVPPGSAIGDLLRGDESNPFVKFSRQAMQEQRFIHVQEWFAQQKLWLDIRLYPSRDGLTVYFLDITRQREEEMELRLLRMGVSRLNDIIIITEATPLDEPGPRIIFINEAFERITGYKPSEVIGKSPRFLQGPETQQEVLERFRQALERCEPVRSQIINYKKSGKPFWLEIDIAPIADVNGHYTHFVSVERDITESKAMEDQLQHAQRMEAVGLLTGGIAHDFNNLLTVILGNADMLAEALGNDADLQPLAQMIVQAADHGADLVRSLLAFARRQPLDPGTLVVATMVRDLMPILKASLTKKHQLKLDIQEPLWTAYVDRGQLESALLNLVINARDAMPGSGELTITLTNVRRKDTQVRSHRDMAPGDYVQIEVKDTGTGIAPQDIDRIFEPFFSTKMSGRGSGLGLSSVFGFVKQSGGHITVQSELGVGTTFRLDLPRSREDADATPAGSSLTVAANADSQCILVVEDEDGIRRLAVYYLEQAGYRTLQAANGEEALTLIQQGAAPDLLFTDMDMPGALPGPALVSVVRQHLPALPVLYTSGFAEFPHLLPEAPSSHEGFLTKPYRREQLLARISFLLGHTDPP